MMALQPEKACPVTRLLTANKIFAQRPCLIRRPKFDGRAETQPFWLSFRTVYPAEVAGEDRFRLVAGDSFLNFSVGSDWVHLPLSGTLRCSSSAKFSRKTVVDSGDYFFSCVGQFCTSVKG